MLADYTIVLFVLFYPILYIQVNNFPIMSQVFLGWTIT